MTEAVAPGEQITEAGDEQAVLPPTEGEQTSLEAVPVYDPEPLPAQEEAPEALMSEAAQSEADEPASASEIIAAEPEPIAVHSLEVSAPEISGEIPAPAPATNEHAVAGVSAAPQPAATQASVYSIATRLLEKAGAQQRIWFSYAESELKAKLTYGRVLSKSRTPVDVILASNAEYLRALVASSNVLSEIVADGITLA
ncbi:hypothetical protein [Methylobacterium nodulans]|nr:hypothetical protein [Methylobacterium nodulans]ACL61176.1 conserved hypothetical protein [Methylobacterium nodulans ORS 2060]